MLRIVHLVWNLIRGGTEGQCARVAIELARRGIQQRVVVFRREGFFLPAVEEQCGDVSEIGIHKLASLQTFQSVRRMARWMRAEKVSLLHTWDADAAIFGQFAAAWAGIPLITSRRDLGQIYPAHKVKLLRRADQKARFTVANAQGIVDEFVRQGQRREPFLVIPNILDAFEFDQLSSKPFSRFAELPPGERVVMVSRLDPEKDISTFIYAAGRILMNHPKASFIVAGDGVERSMLEKRAKNQGLGNKMVFLGEVTEIPALLKECHIGVLTPNRNEGLSNTILEYMAAGLPVVATDCGGNRELVQPPRGGQIVPVSDRLAVADAVLDLLRKPGMRKSMGEANRKVVVDRHQPGPVGDQFLELYRRVLTEA